MPLDAIFLIGLVILIDQKDQILSKVKDDTTFDPMDMRWIHSEGETEG